MSKFTDFLSTNPSSRISPPYDTCALTDTLRMRSDHVTFCFARVTQSEMLENVSCRTDCSPFRLGSLSNSTYGVRGSASTARDKVAAGWGRHHRLALKNAAMTCPGSPSADMITWPELSSVPTHIFFSLGQHALLGGFIHRNINTCGQENEKIYIFLPLRGIRVKDGCL